jgi:hypothetical protein
MMGEIKAGLSNIFSNIFKKSKPRCSPRSIDDKEKIMERLYPEIKNTYTNMIPVKKQNNRRFTPRMNKMKAFLRDPKPTEKEYLNR